MFWIDMQDDFPMNGTIIRIRDETRYVQDVLTGEMLFRMEHLNWEDRTALREEFMKVLCNKWYLMFGERIKPVRPEGPGIAWGIEYDYPEDKELSGATRQSIEGR